MCVLNEEGNIVDCINSIRQVSNSRIVVYDGGSTDNTVELAIQQRVEVIEAPKTSLSYRRQLAANNSRSEYIFYVDADHRIDSLKGQLNYLVEKYFKYPDVAGFMLRKKGDTREYWSTGFEQRMKLIDGQLKEPKVIGMPCIYKTKLVQDIGFDSRVTGSIDDTMLCHKLGERGYTFRVTDEYVIEKFRSSFRTTVKKAFWYGLGDAEFIRINKKEAKINHIYHVVIRNLVLNPFNSLASCPRFFPFFLCFGIVRASGFAIGLIKRKDLTMLSS